MPLAASSVSHHTDARPCRAFVFLGVTSWHGGLGRIPSGLGCLETASLGLFYGPAVVEPKKSSPHGLHAGAVGQVLEIIRRERTSWFLIDSAKESKRETSWLLLSLRVRWPRCCARWNIWRFCIRQQLAKLCFYCRRLVALPLKIEHEAYDSFADSFHRLWNVCVPESLVNLFSMRA